MYMLINRGTEFPLRKGIISGDNRAKCFGDTIIGDDMFWMSMPHVSTEVVISFTGN
jgi:hypothetical protein